MTPLSEIGSHTLTFAQNPIHWRFEDEGDEIPYEDHKESILPLTKEGAAILDRFIHDSSIHNDFPFQKGRFRNTEVLSLEPVTHQDGFKSEDKKVKKWMYELGVPFKNPVFVSYDRDCGFIMPWKLLIKYWRNFYYSISDDITIFDDSLQWCLLMFHEHEFYFGTNKERRVNQATHTTPASASR